MSADNNTADTPSNTPSTPQKDSAAKKAMKAAKSTAGALDSANGVMENAGNLFNMVKWICITIVVLVLAGGGYGIYKAVTKPVAAVGGAIGSAADGAKSGAEAVKDKASDIKNHLLISPRSQRTYDAIAEAAFARLTAMEPTKAAGMKDRMFRSTHLGGHEGRVCAFDLDFGHGAIPVYAAADNKDYAKSKALGAKDNRLMRIVLIAEGDKVAFNSEWDSDAKNWAMKWKATAIKKPISDSAAAERISDVLKAVPEACPN